jgi:hypothetical protein
MNLTYLCYGDPKIGGCRGRGKGFRLKPTLTDKLHKAKKCSYLIEGRQNLVVRTFLRFGKIKKVEKLHLFCPKSYHELNLLMLWLS